MSRRRCCCGDSTGCPCNTFSFDFEVLRQAGVGGTERSVQILANVCDMLNDLDDEGTSITRLVGTATFACTVLDGWQYSTGTAQYDPNVDMNGAVGYRWSRPPSYTLGRCTDEACQTCDSEIVWSWTVTNDTSSINLGLVATYATMPGVLAKCFPTLPSTPVNGIYRVVWLSLTASADRASRRVETNTPYNGGSCPPNSDTTSAASSIGNIPVHVGFLWDAASICDAGTLVGTFEWDGVTTGCTTGYPFDNDNCTTTTTTQYCTPGPAAICCSGTAGVPEPKFDWVTEACFFDFRDADATNWTTT